MNRDIEQKIEKLKTKLNCKMESCGSQFVFEIDKDLYEIKKTNPHYRYIGECKRCYKVLKITKSSIRALDIGFGKCEFKITGNKFNDLFEKK